MFLRRYRRTKDGKVHTYYALVESVRTDAGPRQRIVAYLGELNHDQERRWQRTVVFHNRQGDARATPPLPRRRHSPTCPMIPTSCRIRIRESSAGPTRALRRCLAGTLVVAVPCASTRSSNATSRKARRRLRRPTSWPSRSSIASVQPCSEFALAEHWYASTASRISWASPTEPSPRTASIARSTACSKLSKPSRTILKATASARCFNSITTCCSTT